jgi:hypothetical protein
MRYGILGLAIAALFALVADLAHAASVTQVGLPFSNEGHESAGADRLGFFTFDPPDKAASLMVEINHSDPNQPADKLFVGFLSKEDWARFTAIWRKALRAKRPTEAEALDVKSHAGEVGSYFDLASKTDLTVSVGTEGDIDFTMAGKPDANNSPTVLELFQLVPKDFKAFGKQVDAVTAYFAK